LIEKNYLIKYLVGMVTEKFKNSVKEVLTVTEEKTDSVKKAGKNFFVEYIPKVKQKSSNFLKRIRGFAPMSQETKPVNVSTFFSEKSEALPPLAEIPSIEVDTFNQFQDIIEVGKEAFFEKRNQIPLNEIPSESRAVKNNSSFLQDYFNSILTTLGYHLFFITQKPLLYAITYPVQTVILLALFGSSLFNVYKFFFPTQTPVSNSFSEEGSKSLMTEQTQEVLTWDQKIAQTKAELELHRTERDSATLQARKELIQPKVQKSKSYLELGPPGAEAFGLEEGVKVVEVITENVLESLAREPVKIETTEKATLKLFDTITEAHKAVDEANNKLVDNVNQSCADRVSGGISETKLECEKGKNTFIEELGTKCDSKIDNAIHNIKEEYRNQIKTKAEELCRKDQTKIEIAQEILKGPPCEASPKLCLKQLRQILPLAEGNYPEKNTSVWERIGNVFKK
jgi:hypothetical protein